MRGPVTEATPKAVTWNAPDPHCPKHTARFLGTWDKVREQCRNHCQFPDACEHLTEVKKNLTKEQQNETA